MSSHPKQPLSGISSGTDVDHIAGTAAAMTAYLSAAGRHAANAGVDKVSGFWREHLAARPNFPGVNELMTFRRRGFTRSVGEEPQNDEREAHAYHKRMYELFRGIVSVDLLHSIPEPSLGAPYVFEQGGVARSASFWLNAATANRIAHFVRKFGPTGPLRVCEIGAGFGCCAYQLHHLLPVQSYTIIDLPENLYLSANYLAAGLPDRKLHLIPLNEGDGTAIPKNVVAVGVPSAIHRLNAQFDLVLNSFSMQEMDAESVREYVDWISASLSDQGIFVSLNSHGKAGIRRPSEYGFSTFRVRHLGVFRTAPTGFFNTIPYEVVLSRPDSSAAVIDNAELDAIGNLMQLGLDKDIATHCDGLVAGNLDQKMRRVLAVAGQVFDARSDADREDALERWRIVDESAVVPYVHGMHQLAQGRTREARRNLESACACGLSGFARMRADVLLAALSGNELIQSHGLTDAFPVKSVYPEAARLVDSRKLGPAIDHINRVLGRHPEWSDRIRRAVVGH